MQQKFVNRPKIIIGTCRYQVLQVYWTMSYLGRSKRAIRSYEDAIDNTSRLLHILKTIWYTKVGSRVKVLTLGNLLHSDAWMVFLIPRNSTMHKPSMNKDEYQLTNQFLSPTLLLREHNRMTNWTLQSKWIQGVPSYSSLICKCVSTWLRKFLQMASQKFERKFMSGSLSKVSLEREC